MNITVDELRPVIDAWRWPQDPSTQAALLALGFVFFVAIVLLYLPLSIQWVRVAKLNRKLGQLAHPTAAATSASPEKWNRAFQNSPAEFQWSELQSRWVSQITSNASGEPASLASMLQRWPLAQRGLRGKALDSVPGLLMLLGVMGAVVSMSLAFSNPAAFGSAPAMSGLGATVLAAPLWGLSLALIATLASRLFHGVFEHYNESLDRHASAAFQDFCDAHREETQSTQAEVTRLLDPEFHKDPELESTHLAHLQLNKVTRQMSSLIDHLHESGFALRNAASALRSTQGRLENNSEEIRISLKQAASAVVDQGGFIQMSLDQIRATLKQPEIPIQRLRVPESSQPEDLPLNPSNPVQTDSTSSSAGLRLGPDPYARLEARDREDAKTVQRLLERRESEGASRTIEDVAPLDTTKEGPGKLSDLLAQASEKNTGSSSREDRPSMNTSRPHDPAGKAGPPITSPK
ncbi:MAG: hypothetical protein CMN75_06965 [Spirochaeta sp.]|nr:hypothetical protein [Spirochaeta sp.]RPG04030.1 MAG: hypothetical protein CBC32_015170 [Proteobacteria bacterium TMED72]